jgi:hypothetical protein
VDWGDESGDNDDEDDDDGEREPCKDWDEWCLQQQRSVGESSQGYGLLSRIQTNLWGWGPGKGGKDKKGDDKKKKDDDEDGEGKKKISNRMPKPVVEVDCVVCWFSASFVSLTTDLVFQECYRWEFGSYKDDSSADGAPHEEVP